MRTLRVYKECNMLHKTEKITASIYIQLLLAEELIL